MSATSASVLSGPPGTDPYSSPMALKVEPDVVGGAGGPPRIGSRHEVTSSPVNVSSEEEQRQQQQLRDCLESHVSDPAKTSIARMVEEVETMTDMERLLLFMRLPNARPGIETSLAGLSGAPGTSNLHLSNQLEQSQAYTWIMSHLEEHASTCLRKDEVYDDYRSYCENHQMKSLNTADFGKVMKRAFPNVKPRRLGQRGQSKYCYGGMRKRVEVQPPYLPDLNPSAPQPTEAERAGHGSGSSSTRAASSGSSEGGGGGGVSVGESMLPECILLVLEWAEKVLCRQFDSLRQLAEYLVTNMYVNSRSCAAFALVADIHGQSTARQVNGGGKGTITTTTTTPNAALTSSKRAVDGRRRASVGAREDVRTPGEAAPLRLSSFATPPASRLSPRPPLARSQTPPGPPITAYSAASVRRRLASPDASASSAAAAAAWNNAAAPAVPFCAPPVKPNLLQLPSNLKDAFVAQQSTPSLPPPTPAAYAAAAAAGSHHHPMRAFPPYFGHGQQPQPPAAHTQSPFQRYPVLCDAGSGGSGGGGGGGGAPEPYPPPPLQYGGGAYTPVHRGKRPYEATTQEHYSPYYSPNNATYPAAGDYTSPKRHRFASMGESSTDYGAATTMAYYQPPPQPPPQQSSVNGNFAASSQFANFDPYSYGVGMLSPRASSSSSSQQQQQQQRQQQQQQQQQQQLPRLGCSPGPYTAPQRASPFAEPSQGAAKLEAAGPSRVLLPSLPKLGGGRPPSRSQPMPRVGRTPSPVRFTAGPAVGPGLRRPSPLRTSPGQPSSHGSHGAAALGSPDSSGGGSIQLRRSPGSPFRSLGGRKGEPSGSGDQGDNSSAASAAPASAAVAAAAAAAAAVHRRSADLHTPTPPTSCADQFFFPRTDNEEPSPPSAFL